MPPWWRCSSSGAPVHSQWLWSPSGQCCLDRNALSRHKADMSSPHTARKPQRMWYHCARRCLQGASMTIEACLLTSELWWPPGSEERRVNLSRQRADKPFIYPFTCTGLVNPYKKEWQRKDIVCKYKMTATSSWQVRCRSSFSPEQTAVLGSSGAR